MQRELSEHNIHWCPPWLMFWSWVSHRCWHIPSTQHSVLTMNNCRDDPAGRRSIPALQQLQSKVTVSSKYYWYWLYKAKTPCVIPRDVKQALHFLSSQELFAKIIINIILYFLVLNSLQVFHILPADPTQSPLKCKSPDKEKEQLDLDDLMGISQPEQF